jgi:hypothetical protein
MPDPSALCSEPHATTTIDVLVSICRFDKTRAILLAVIASFDANLSSGTVQ